MISIIHGMHVPAITRLKEERDKCTRVQDEPVVEESLPVVKLGTSCGGNGSMMTIGKGSSDKKSWMSSAQLWNAETESVNSRASFFFVICNL